VNKVAIPLALAAIVAIAAPASTHFGVSAYGSYREASIRHADLKLQQRELRAYAEQVAEYKRFATRVERFISTAYAAGIADGGWNRHHVDIEKRVVSFTELAQLVTDHAGGDNYYFLPYKLRIEARGAGGVTNPFGRGGARTSRDEVMVSLAGDFLVPIE
jgi:hypothetical protein